MRDSATSGSSRWLTPCRPWIYGWTNGARGSGWPGDAFLGGALRRLRFGGVRRFGRGARIGLLAAADPLGGGAQASAHALGLRLLGFALGVALGLGARVVLAAHELDVGDLGAVAL